MNIKTIYRKLFLSGEWRIAFRSKTDTIEQGIYIPIHNTLNYWFADPLLFEDYDKTYIFCEAFNRKSLKGDLGFFEIRDGHIGSFELLINQNFHMSFPNVFKYRDEYYMIPESGENLTLDLYKADAFPRNWVLYKNLISGYNYADPTLVKIDGQLYMFVYVDKRDEYQTKIYRFTDDLDVEFFQLIEYKENIGRSAGKFFKDDKGQLYRPAQMSKGEYGKSIIIYRVNFINGKFSEEIDHLVNSSEIEVGKTKGVDRIHTYSCSNNYEVIDYTIYHFDLLKRFKILMRKCKRVQRSNRKQNEKL